ncbi:mitochondrial PGP phosphatase-domain-containing protein [Pilobolus umbonatus]|nr:mitochondrial PGP phosphatase-domain-containing protein [Pilobolus umbonatus]
MVQSLNISGVINAFRLLWNPSLAMPHIIIEDIRSIHYVNLKKMGNIKAMAFDKDNCLTAPYVSTIYPPFKDAWNTCKSTFGEEKIIIVSNSAGTKDDVGYKEAKHLEESLGVKVLKHSQKKPSGGEYLKQHLYPLSPQEVAFTGDRIFTDIVFGNLNGNLTIWTKKIVTEKGDNKAALWMRRLEHKFIHFLQKMDVKAPPHPALDKCSIMDFIKADKTK